MKHIRIFLMLAFCVAILVHARVAFGQKSSDTQDWTQLGTHLVDYTLDYDAVPITYKKGTFTAIKIRVNDGNINMHRCMITFENGEKQEVEIKHMFTAGTEKVIDLKGNNRIIDKVAFWYDTKNKSDQKAVVQVWGKK